MPEPDFDRIAHAHFCRLRVSQTWDPQEIRAEVASLAEQLRLIWNARGAALIDPVTNAVDEWVRAGAGTYDELQAVVEQAIKKLDR